MLEWNLRFSARCSWDIRSSELLRGVGWFVTSDAEQFIGTIVKGQDFQGESL